MKVSEKIVLSVILTACISIPGTAYLTNQVTVRKLIYKEKQVEIINGIGRIESWNRVTNYVYKGCSKELLEYVENEKKSEIGLLQSIIGSDDKLMSIVQQRAPDIEQQIFTFSGNDGYAIPPCD